MDILTVVAIFFLIEVVISGTSWYTGREKHEPEKKKESKTNVYDLGRQAPSIISVDDPPRTWSAPTEHELNREEYARRCFLLPPSVQ
jgi:hypothetical protein